MTTQKFTPYQPKEKDYPSLTKKQFHQLAEIEPSNIGEVNLKPCKVTLNSGENIDNVFIAEAKNYIKYWGAWPEDDPGKNSIAITDVAEIMATPNRLPLHIVEEIYTWGETRMGGVDFILEFSDGANQAYRCGNIFDFLQLPTGKTMLDVVSVRPLGRKLDNDFLSSSEFYWCLYG